MAGLQERSGSYRINFRYHGKHHFVTIGKVSEEEAQAKTAQVDYLLMRLKQRLIQLPDGVGIVEFILHDGQTPVPADGNKNVAKALTLAEFRDRYLDTHGPSLERAHHRGDRAAFQAPGRRPGRSLPDPRAEAGRPAGLCRRPRQGQGDERQASQCRDDQEGDRQPAHGMELGRQNGTGFRPVP